MQKKRYSLTRWLSQIFFILPLILIISQSTIANSHASKKKIKQDWRQDDGGSDENSGSGTDDDNSGTNSNGELGTETSPCFDVNCGGLSSFPQSPAPLLPQQELGTSNSGCSSSTSIGLGLGIGIPILSSCSLICCLASAAIKHYLKVKRQDRVPPIAYVPSSVSSGLSIAEGDHSPSAPPPGIFIQRHYDPTAGIILPQQPTQFYPNPLLPPPPFLTPLFLSMHDLPSGTSLLWPGITPQGTASFPAAQPTT